MAAKLIAQLFPWNSKQSAQGGAGGMAKMKVLLVLASLTILAGSVLGENSAEDAQGHAMGTKRGCILTR